jgi:hypothetical protein
MIGLAALALFAAGCGGGKVSYAPVSGRVTMDGKPLANVHVQYQPMASEGNNNPGPGSYGATDADGRYTLKISSQQVQGDGAVIGKHRVSIGTILEGEGKIPTDRSLGSEDGTPLAGKEIIPERYNQNSTLTMDVPAGGRTDANFDLKMKP